MLRKFKLYFKLYNFFQKKKLKHNLPKYKHKGLKKKYYSSIRSKDFEGIPYEVNIHDRLNSKDELPNKKKFKQLDKKIQEEMLSWSDKGYVVLKKYFDTDKVDHCNEIIDRLLDEKKVKFFNGNKIMFAIHQSDVLKSMGNHDQIKDILSLLLGKDIWTFQSLNFITGSQQGAHSDAISMTTFPHGNLIAIWIALEDITMDNGPLFYYRGSHKLPYVMNHNFGNESSKFKLGNKTYSDYLEKIQEELKKGGFKKEYFLAKKGDVLIWHHNLVHGGEKVVNPSLTRKSMVFHYYANDAIAYHEITERPTLKHL